MRALMLASVLVLTRFSCAQAGSTAESAPNQRTFAASVPQIQVAIKKLQPIAGRLPALDGFVVADAKSLDQYRRPYYQCVVHVTSAASGGGSLVRVTAKITAWRENPPHSGYEVLQSNGRLESDLLDRLQESLAPNAMASVKSEPAPEISAPMPQFPKQSRAMPADATNSADLPLRDEARSLEEVIRNQSRPTNLVAVKQDATPLLENARADAKVLFLASAEDEFEVLDANPEWVHVRISGLSRGWLRRATVEMLDGSDPKTETPSRAEQAGAAAPTGSLFSISSEEVGNFPGTWDVLKGKSTRIISVQQAPGSGRITSPQDKLRFATSIFRKEALPAGVDGLVLIFDAEDGGMIAAKRESLDQFQRGAISEGNFWKQCFLDPPEILGALTSN